MRKPTTPMGREWDWWRAALAGERVDYHDADPRPGFFRRRLVKGGPWVPVKIWWHSTIDVTTGELAEPEKLLCVVNLKPRDPYSEWTWVARHPISREAYSEMIDLIEWAGSNDPTHPVLNPEQPIDLTRRVSCPTTT